MCPSPDGDDSVHAALAAVEAVISRFLEANKSDPDDPADSSVRVGYFPALQQRSQQLNEHCEEAIDEIRGSLDEAIP